MQEAEGGILLIGAYMRILQPEGTVALYPISAPCQYPATPGACCFLHHDVFVLHATNISEIAAVHAGGAKADSGEAEARLLTFCRRFVANAAEDAWASHQAAVRTGASDIHTWDQVSLHVICRLSAAQVYTCWEAVNVSMLHIVTFVSFWIPCKEVQRLCAALRLEVTPDRTARSGAMGQTNTDSNGLPGSSTGLQILESHDCQPASIRTALRVSPACRLLELRC